MGTSVRLFFNLHLYLRGAFWLLFHQSTIQCDWLAVLGFCIWMHTFWVPQSFAYIGYLWVVSVSLSFAVFLMFRLYICAHTSCGYQSGRVVGVFYLGHFGVANALHWCISQFCWVIYVCFYICAHTLWLTHSGCAGLFYLGCFGVAMHRTVLLYFLFSRFQVLQTVGSGSGFLGGLGCPPVRA